MNERIKEFIKKQTCASFCCVDEEGRPYCFTCFYAFDSDEGLLYFKTSVESSHYRIININPVIAGTILPDKLNRVLVKGVQFDAVALSSHHPLAAQASAVYHKKHPMALVMTGEVQTIQINKIKMTDSTKGFGKKITWCRNE